MAKVVQHAGRDTGHHMRHDKIKRFGGKFSCYAHALPFRRFVLDGDAGCIMMCHIPPFCTVFGCLASASGVLPLDKSFRAYYILMHAPVPASSLVIPALGSPCRGTAKR